MQDFVLRCFFLLLTAAVVAAGPAKREVGQWEVFELELKGPNEGNPFTEVEFSARFSQGDRTLTVSGFYDGEGRFKVRFMPDTVGAWRYETLSNRTELAGRTGELAVQAAGPGNHGPVRVAHTFHFAYADGTPFRQLGTTSYSWAHQSDALAERTLRTLAGAPFNKVRMCILPPPGNNLQFFPFVGTAPKAWDFTRFDPAFFRNLESRIDGLLKLGIEADVILFNPYDNRWGFSSMTPEHDDRLVRYIVARLAAYRNVWWSLANEYDFNQAKTETDWDRLFAVLTKADPYHRLTSIHNGFQIYNNTRPWVTHASLQQGAAVLDPERAMIYRDVYRKPIVYDEVKYEGTRGRRWGRLKPEEMVLRFWNGTVAGTYVGHSETLRGSDGAWLSIGGELHGESVARLAFLKQILAESPAEGIDPIDKWQERRMGGKQGEYYLLYFGEQAPTVWPFTLYKAGLAEGMIFNAEIIDTWAMTITPVEGTFELKRKDDYDFVDKEGRSIALPGRPYLALRLRRVGGAATGPTATADPEP